MVTRIKICGITNKADADAAVKCGAHALGFVMEPSSPRCVAAAFVEEIVSQLPPYVDTVAVFGPPPTISIPRGIHAIQCSGTIADHLSSVYKRIEVMRLADGAAETEAIEIALAARGAVLLDAFASNAFGGTGKKVNWDLAARMREAVSPRPLVLAGGLDPENVAEAIRTVRPFAVDVVSGVERMPGVKDVEKLLRFCEAVRETDRASTI